MLVSRSIPDSIAPTEDVALDSTDIEAWARRQSWSKDGAPDVTEGSYVPEDFKPEKHAGRRVIKTVTDPETGENDEAEGPQPLPHDRP